MKSGRRRRAMLIAVRVVHEDALVAVPAVLVPARERERRLRTLMSACRCLLVRSGGGACVHPHRAADTRRSRARCFCPRVCFRSVCSHCSRCACASSRGISPLSRVTVVYGRVCCPAHGRTTRGHEVEFVSTGSPRCVSFSVSLFVVWCFLHCFFFIGTAICAMW